MRLPWTAWEKTLRRMGLKLIRKTRSYERHTRRPHLEQLESREVMASSITNFHLVNDTGTSNSDRITSDPRVAGTVSGSWMGGMVSIEFDHNGDGVVDGSTYVMTPGQGFTYDPAMSQPSLAQFNGTLDLKYRNVDRNSMNQVTYTGSWTTFSMTLDHPQPVEIEVVDAWANVVADGAGSVSFGSTTQGTPVSKTFTVRNLGTGTLTVNTNSFSLPSGFSLTTPPSSTVAANMQTTFTVQMTASTFGVYNGTISFGNNDSDENPYNFTISGDVTVDGPEVDLLDTDGTTSLADGSNYSLGTTTQGQAVSRTLKVVNRGGSPLHLSNLSLPSGVTLISTFGSTTVGGNGGETTFTFRFDAAVVGSFSGGLSFTTDDTDENPFNLTLQSTVNIGEGSGAIRVDGLGLTRDSGLSSTDLATCDPRLSGTVNGSFPSQTVDVEFDHNSDGAKEGFVHILSSGTAFTYDSRTSDPALATFVGAANFQYRLVVRDGNGNAVSTGSWHTFAFNMVAGPGAGGIDFASLDLLKDTGTSASDRVTTNPGVFFILSGDFSTSTARVEFDRNGDGTPEATSNVYAAGVTFDYDPRQTDPSLIGFLGNTAFYYRLKKLDTSGNVVATGAWDSFRFTLVDPPSSQLVVQDLMLTNDTGESNSDKITIDPTIRGKVGGTASTGDTMIPAIPSVELDQDGDGVVDSLVEVDQNKNFSVVPDPAAYGETTVRIRAREWDRSYGAFTYSSWTPFTFTYQATPAAPVDELALVNDTGASTTDKITRETTIKGRLTGSNVALQLVHLDLNNDGVDEATTYTDEQGNFEITPNGVAVGSVTARFRSSRLDPKTTNEVFGPWNSFSFTFQAVPAAATGGLGLLTDTGSSDSDNVTSDPTIHGTLTGDTNLGSVRVEFDHNGDGTPDGSTISDPLGNFYYRPAGLGLGEATVRARSRQWDTNAGSYVYSNWSSITFIVEAAPFVAASMGPLTLYQDTGSSSSDNITTQGAVIGIVYTTSAHISAMTYMTVEIDANGDGVVDTKTQTGGGGSFRYVPLNQTPGTYTIRARTKQWDYGTRQIQTGLWNPITYTIVAVVNNPPSITGLRLGSDSGSSPSDGYTANPMIAGTVSNDQPGRLVVEVDDNNDYVGDGLAFTDDTGAFHYTPEPLSYGSITIHARPIEWDEAAGHYQMGSWATLSFTYESQPAAAATFANFGLANGVTGGTTDPTLRGSIINGGSLGGVTVEFDLNGDGTPDQFAQTDAYGGYSHTPTGLAYGSVSIGARTRQVDPVTGNVLVGSWSNLSFTYNQTVNAAPTVSGVTLKNDTGSSSTDGQTTDSTIIGTVGNDGPAGGLTVQYDLNGDGLAEGQVASAADGKFALQPANLPYGSQTIRVRAKEVDSAQGAVQYSAWQTIQFTLLDPVASTVHVDALTLTHDTGSSGTDGATTDSTLSGHVANAQTGTSVQFDLNGDGISDGSAQTDANGNFSFAPANLQEGYITAQARVGSSEFSSGNGTVPGADGGMTLNFVLNSQPDGSEAQALVTAFHNYNTSWNSAQATYKSASAQAELTYRQAVQAAEDTYDTTIADAAAIQRGTANGANSSYNTIVASANAIYMAALVTAKTQFAANLANFQGDKTSFSLKDFELPDSPVEFAAIIPPDATQPLPPEDAPKYTGENYDFSADTQYQSDLASADADYASTTKQLGDTLTGQTQTANNNYALAVKAANNDYQAAVRQASIAYGTALKQGVNPIDKAAEQQKLNDTIATAESKVRAAVAWNLAVQTAANILYIGQRALKFAEIDAWWQTQRDAVPSNYYAYYAQHYNWPPEMAQDYLNLDEQKAQKYADANQTYANNVAAAARTRTEKDADAVRTSATTIDNAQLTFDQKMADWQLWEDTRRIGAARDQSAAIALAEKGRSIALANALLTKVTALADAAKNYAVGLGQAAGQRSIDKANAAKAAVDARASAENSPWWDYQKKLVDNAVEYITDLVPKVVQKFTADAQAERDEIVFDAGKAKDLTVAAAELRRVQAVADADSFKTFALDAAGHQKTYSRDEALLNFAQLESRADAEKTFAYASAAAEEKRAKDTATSNKTAAYENAATNAHVSNPSSRTYFFALSAKDSAVRLAGITSIYTKEIVTAKETRGTSRTTARKTYEFGVHGKVQMQNDADTDSFKVYQTQAADHAKAFATGYAGEYETFLKAVSTKAAATKKAEDQTEESLENEEAQLEKDRAEADAEAQKGLLSAVAGAFQTLIGAWSAAVNTPWSRLQKANADVEKNQADAEGTLNKDIVSQAGGFVLGYLNGVAGIGKTLADAIADGLDAENQTLAAAVKKYATDVATARHTLDTTMADKVAQRDKDVTGLTKTYADQQSTRQKARDDAVDSAQWDYEREVADRTELFTTINAGIDFNLAVGSITSDQATTQRNQQATSKTIDLGVYEQTRKTAVATAESSRANGNATDFKTWVNDVGQKNVDLATNAKTAMDKLAADVKAADDGLNGDEAAAAQALTAVLANAQAAAQVGNAQAGANLNNALSPVAGNNTITETDIGNHRRQAMVHNRASYETDLRTEHKDKMLAATAPAGAMQLLLPYQRAAAQQDVTWSTAKGVAVDAHEQVVSTAYLQQAQGHKTANINRAASEGTGDVASTTARATAEATLSINTTDNLATLGLSNASAATQALKSGVVAETKYDLSRAKARKEYVDAVAQAYVLWTSKYVEIQVAVYLDNAIPYVPAGYQNPPGTTDETNRDARKAAAEVAIQADFSAAEKAARSTFAGKVGDGQIDRAGDLGSDGVTETGDVGDANVNYENDSASDDASYEAATTASEVGRIQAHAQSDATYKIRMTELQRDLTAVLGASNVTLAQGIGAAHVTRASERATSQASFWSAERSATAARYVASLGSEPTTHQLFLAAQASAQSQWITDIVPAYLAYTTAMAQADTNQVTALTQAVANQDNALANATVNYVAASEPLSAAAQVARIQADRAWIEAESAADHTRAKNEAIAQRVYDVADANAFQTHGISYASADKSYQVAYVNASGSDYAALQHTHDLAFADADLTRETTSGNSDVTWTTSVAAGKKTWRKTGADATQAYLVEQARIDRDLIVALAPHQQALFISRAAAQTTFWTAETSALTARRSANYIAIASYEQATLAARSNSIADIAVDVPLPWTNYQSVYAAAMSDWYVTSGRSQFQSMGTLLNAADITYRVTANALYTTWATNSATAETNYEIALASGNYAIEVGDATAERTYEHTVADADAAWQIETASTRRAERIGLETARRNLVADGNLTAFNLALTTVASAKRAAKATSAHGFTVSAANAAAASQVSSGDIVRAQTLVKDDARRQYSNAVEHANQLFSTGEAIANAERSIARSTALYDYDKNYFLALQLLSDDVADENGTPWAILDSAVAEALSTRQATLDEAAKAHDIGFALALRDFELAKSHATETRGISEASALAVVDDQRAAIKYDQVTTQAGTTVARAAAISLPGWEDKHTEAAPNAAEETKPGSKGKTPPSTTPKPDAPSKTPTVLPQNKPAPAKASDSNPNKTAATPTPNPDGTPNFDQLTDPTTLPKRQPPDSGSYVGPNTKYDVDNYRTGKGRHVGVRWKSLGKDAPAGWDNNNDVLVEWEVKDRVGNKLGTVLVASNMWTGELADPRVVGEVILRLVSKGEKFGTIIVPANLAADKEVIKTFVEENVNVGRLLVWLKAHPNATYGRPQPGPGFSDPNYTPPTEKPSLDIVIIQRPLTTMIANSLEAIIVERTTVSQPPPGSRPASTTSDGRADFFDDNTNTRTTTTPGTTTNSKGTIRNSTTITPRTVPSRSAQEDKGSAGADAIKNTIIGVNEALNGVNEVYVVGYRLGNQYYIIMYRDKRFNIKMPLDTVEGDEFELGANEVLRRWLGISGMKLTP